MVSVRSLVLVLIASLLACGNTSYLDVKTAAAEELPDGRVSVHAFVVCGAATWHSCEGPWCLRATWIQASGAPFSEKLVAPPIDKVEVCVQGTLEDNDWAETRFSSNVPVDGKGTEILIEVTDGAESLSAKTYVLRSP